MAGLGRVADLRGDFHLRGRHFEVGSHLGDDRRGRAEMDTLPLRVEFLAHQLHIVSPPLAVAASHFDRKSLHLLHSTKIVKKSRIATLAVCKYICLNRQLLHLKRLIVGSCRFERFAKIRYKWGLVCLWCSFSCMVWLGVKPYNL